MTRWKLATPGLILISVLIACALPVPEESKAYAAANPEVSKPSAAPEYVEMLKALTDRDNRRLKKVFVTDPSRKIVAAPDKTPQALPLRFRPPTAAEIEKMGPLWPSVPPEKNAAYYFGKAILLDVNREAAEPAGSASSGDPYAGDIESLAKWIERTRPALAAMREGLAQDIYSLPMVIADETGTPVPPMFFFSGVRQIARDLADAGFVEEVKGNPDGAASYYLDCIRLGKKLQNGTVIECLVGVAAQGVGQRALDPLVANAALSEKTLREVVVTCREAEAAQDAPARIGASESALIEAVAALESARYRDDPKEILSLQQAKALSDFSARKPLDELLRKKTMEAAFANDLKDKADEESQKAKIRSFVNLGRINVSLRATQIRAAIALYQKATGRLPDGLGALCPDMLPSVPIDPFSGKPMRYAKTLDGWNIWSVGPDNSDNGGEVYVVDEKGARPLDDIVFTSQVQSNIERRSRGAIKRLPTPAEKPRNAGKAE